MTINRFDRPYSIVNEHIDDMSKRADEALERAYSTLDELKQVGDGLDSLPPTPSIDLGIDQAPAFLLPERPDLPSLGSISAPQLPTLDVDVDASDLTLEEAPTFTPSVVAVEIPAAPAPIDLSGAPERPAMIEVAIPDAPNLAVPSIGSLAEIKIPAFVFPELPTFDARAPEFEGTAPNTVLHWSEPAYQSALLDEVKGRVRAMLAGGTGLPAAVEQALFGRAHEREAQVAQRAVDEAFQDFASRGHMLPPGALAKRTAIVREQNSLRGSELAREVFIKCAEWEIENLRNAVAQGIALESTLLGSFDNMAARSFEVAKLRLQADLDLFNASVTLFNARQNAYQTEAGVFQTRLQGELAKLEVFKAQIDGERAKGELNEQTVRLYTAQLQALSSEVEVYKAKMGGAQIKADLNKQQVEAYRADIQAYAEKIAARKVEFDGYESRVRAEQAKIGILEAEARAFAATVQAYDSKNNAKVQAVRTRVEVMNAKIQRYGAQLEAEKARVQAELSQVQALTEAFRADVGRYSAEVGAATSQQQLEQARIEARLRNNLAYYEIELKKYDASMSRLIQQVQVQAEAIKAAGTMTAQLAAGAMAATNVSASLSSSATLSDSTSKSESYSETHSYSYDE